jgi:hypothetical protein
MHFIEDRSRLSTLRSPKDIDSDEYIIKNLKMEIHMMVFHSAESLFLTVLGNYFHPALRWFWMSTCDQNKFNSIMKLWQKKGTRRHNQRAGKVAKRCTLSDHKRV